MTGMLMFPVMLLGPSLAGIALTRMVDGASGLQELFSRMARWKLPLRWYVTLLVPPALIACVLFSLKTLVSPSYAPNHFWVGILFGVPAGFLEEMGWTGFAFQKLRRGESAFTASVLLGLLWSVWHLPVINYLGSATPHGVYWFPFFVAFATVMIAMRVLIAWIYTNTTSVLLAQLMHVSSTGSLVLFSPPIATARQEVLWYGLYGGVLWLVVILIVTVDAKHFIQKSDPA